MHASLFRHAAASLVTLGLLLLFRPALAQGPLPADYIVAVVNSEPITNTEVQARVQHVLRNARERGAQLPSAAALAREVMEQLIVERAQLQQAREMGLEAKGHAIEQAMDHVARQNGMERPALLAHLRSQGLSEQQFARQLGEQLTLQRLREREVDARVRVSDADIDRYLAEQGADNHAIELGHILIAVPEDGNQAEWLAAGQRANRAAAAARNNRDFAAVARQFSDAPRQVLDSGSSMGLRPLSRYPQLFAQAAARADVGSVLGPLRSDAGFHVLKVLDQSIHGLPSTVTQHHARHILLRVDGPDGEARVAAQLRDYKARVQGGQARFEELARAHSQDTGSAPGGGDLGWAAPGQFVPEFEQALQALQPGQISEPVLTRFGMHLIELIERRQARVDAREQREMLRQLVREQKMQADYQTWLQELRARAWVEYREPPQGVQGSFSE